MKPILVNLTDHTFPLYRDSEIKVFFHASSSMKQNIFVTPTIQLNVFFIVKVIFFIQISQR